MVEVNGERVGDERDDLDLVRVEPALTNTRTSGASIGYQVAASISGFAPFLAVLLASVFGWAGGASLYVLVGVIGLLGVLNTRETWGPKEKADVDAIIAGKPGKAPHGEPATSAVRQ